MVSGTINQHQLRDILTTNWMTHEALWYGEVAAKFGMAKASPMNLRVCRKLGQIEFGRFDGFPECFEPSPEESQAKHNKLIQPTENHGG